MFPASSHKQVNAGSQGSTEIEFANQRDALASPRRPERAAYVARFSRGVCLRAFRAVRSVTPGTTKTAKWGENGQNLGRGGSESFSPEMGLDRRKATDKGAARPLPRAETPCVLLEPRSTGSPAVCLRRFLRGMAGSMYSQAHVTPV